MYSNYKWTGRENPGGRGAKSLRTDEQRPAREGWWWGDGKDQSHKSVFAEAEAVCPSWCWESWDSLRNTSSHLLEVAPTKVTEAQRPGGHSGHLRTQEDREAYPGRETLAFIPL